MNSICVFGVFVADLCFFGEKIPVKGQTVLGKNHIVGPGGKGSNQAIAAIVMNRTASKLKKYLKLFFQKNYYSLREKASGGVQPNLNLDIIKNTPVPLCSIEEANFIVEELEKKISVIENIHDSLDEQLKNHKKIKKILQFHMRDQQLFF